MGTAPLSDQGSINLSPKGLDTFKVLNEHTVAYLDYGGSGIETIAHLRENRRIVIMMCAFEGPSKIFRFHGHGEVVLPETDRFNDLATHFNRSGLGARAIIVVEVTRISDSCGYGVPLYEFKEHRDTTFKYIKTHGVEKIKAGLKSQNTESIDGLPGMTENELDRYAAPED